MTLRKIPFEQILALLGAALCLVITILVWRTISFYQSMWPAPGLYFIEIATVCVVTAGLTLGRGAAGRVALWVSAGIVLAFSLLGAFSVGSYYLPVTLLLICAALAADIRARQLMLAHVGLFFAAGILQTALILIMAYFLYK